MTEQGKKTELAQTEFHEMDQRDENQILSELQGHYLAEFVYSFKLKSGKDVTGLSWAGIKEIAYRMQGIQIESCPIEEKPDYWMVTAKAVDVKTRSSRFGVAMQSKMLKLKDGTTEPDDFALQKAMSKAQRNAIRALIPEVTAKQYLEQFLNEKHSRASPFKHVEPERPAPKDVTPPTPTSKTEVEQPIIPDTVCPQCGGTKKPQYDVCYHCHEEENQP